MIYKFLNLIGHYCRFNYTETDDRSELRDTCTIIGRIVYCNQYGVVVEPIIAEEKPFMILYKNIFGVLLTKTVPNEEVVVMVKNRLGSTTDRTICGINTGTTYLSNKDSTTYLELISDVTRIFIPSDDITKIFLKDKENIMYQTKRINDDLDYFVGNKVKIEFKDPHTVYKNDEEVSTVTGIFDRYDITELDPEEIYLVITDDNGNFMRHIPIVGLRNIIKIDHSTENTESSSIPTTEDDLRKFLGKSVYVEAKNSDDELVALYGILTIVNSNVIMLTDVICKGDNCGEICVPIDKIIFIKNSVIPISSSGSCSITSYEEKLRKLESKPTRFNVCSFTVRANKASLVHDLGNDLNVKLRILQRDGWEIINIFSTKCTEYNYDDGTFESLMFVIIAKKGIKDVE